jgi:hypothetical protein
MRKVKREIVRQLPVSVEMIERRIFLIRGQKVMVDTDLAELYQVQTKRLNEQVNRNMYTATRKGLGHHAHIKTQFIGLERG